MAQRPKLWGLLPALGAALCGGIAWLTGASHEILLGSAVLGAAAATLLSSDEEIAQNQPEPTEAPEIEAVEQIDLARSALEALPFGLLIIDANKSIIFTNSIAADLFGIRLTSPLPMATLRARRLLDQIDDVFVENISSVLEFTLTRRGDANLKAHILPLSSGEVLVSIEDETQARRAGAMYRDFVANASHELKTPLASISGIIETLLGHARHDPEAGERFLALLQAQASRMTRLVEDLLSLNRIELNERVQPEELNDLTSIVSETVDALRPIAEADDIDLEVSLPDGRIWVLSDRNEIGQLFGNLIDNAIKYGGARTKIEIVAVPDSPDFPDMIGIEVRDQGPGIPREHIPRLTERFYRVNVGTSRAKGGTGLGLAIVKHILSRHRGRLVIESMPDVGSSFRVWLPVASKDAPEQRVEQESPTTDHDVRVAADS